LGIIAFCLVAIWLFLEQSFGESLKEKEIVRIVIMREDGKVLFLQKGIDSKDPEAYEIPGGEKVPDESLEQAALREVKEEPGI
jgi:8-oxo-dGTP pyrophosphatase MutT (NUDIX family)